MNITNFIYRIANWIPVQSVKTILHLIAKIIAVFLSYIDEAVLSYIFVHPDKDPWKGARDGVVLYFKAWKQLLATSAVIVLINYALTIFLIYFIYIITLPIAASLPFFFADIPFILALIIALIIKVAFMDQWTLVWVIIAYHESIKGMSADSATMNKLEELVPKFKELKNPQPK